MFNDSNSPAVVGDLFRILARHKKKAMLAFAVTMAATAAVILYWPRGYLSEAKLFVRVGRESVGLDPTVTTGQTVGLTDSRETEINSVLEILRSRYVAERVVDALSPRKILGTSSTSRGAASANSKTRSSDTEASVGFRLPGLDPIDDRERAVMMLEKSLSISSPKRTAVINISYQARSPQLAQEILSTLLVVFNKDHARVNRTAGSLGFFEQQVDLLGKQLAAAADQLRNVKNDSGLITFDGQRAMLQQEVSTVEQEMLESRTALAAATARIDSLRATLAALPERMLTQETRGVSVVSDEMRKMLYELELKEIEMRHRMTDEHPLMQEIGSQVSAAREVVARQNKSKTEATQAVNPLREPILVDAAKEHSEAAAAAARLAVLVKEHQLLMTKLKSLNDQEARILLAQRKFDQLDAVYRSYFEKREQARIDDALVQDRISNVNVMQPPSLVARPSSPNKPLLLTLGLFLALCCGGGVGLFAEYSDRSLQCAADVERALEVPVLLTIPYSSRHRVMAN